MSVIAVVPESLLCPCA
uniref:Uncharacterized protein n=1 Tax=Anguilla anguilla TaxID=7936 RepID=A0A0E9PDI8_ANGAN